MAGVSPPTLEGIRARREEILRIAAARGAYNVRVFGSVVYGYARPDSDVDFLVDFPAGRNLLDLCGLMVDLEEALGRRVDVVTAGGESEIERRIEREAVPL